MSVCLCVCLCVCVCVCVCVNVCVSNISDLGLLEHLTLEQLRNFVFEKYNDLIRRYSNLILRLGFKSLFCFNIDGIFAMK